MWNTRQTTFYVRVNSYPVRVLVEWCFNALNGNYTILSIYKRNRNVAARISLAEMMKVRRVIVAEICNAALDDFDSDALSILAATDKKNRAV